MPSKESPMSTKVTKEDFLRFDEGLRIVKTFKRAGEIRVVVECGRDVPPGAQNPTFTFVRAGKNTVRIVGRPKHRVSKHNYARCCAHAVAFFVFLETDKKNQEKEPTAFQVVQQGRQVKHSWIDGYYGNMDDPKQQDLPLPHAI